MHIADTGSSRIAEWRAGGLHTLAGRERPQREVFSFPRSVQTLSKDLWLVADTNNNRIVEIDGRGEVRWQYGNGLPSNGARLRWPRCARRLNRAVVAIADGLNGRILVVERDGKTRAEINSIRLAGQEVELKDPHDVVPTERGTLLIADSLLGLVAEINLHGVAQWWFGSPQNGSPLQDPHQVHEIDAFRVRIVDPYVGIATVNARTGHYRLARGVKSRAGEVLLFHQPKAALETERFLVVADHNASRFSRSLTMRARVGTGSTTSGPGLGVPTNLRYTPYTIRDGSTTCRAASSSSQISRDTAWSTSRRARHSLSEAHSRRATGTSSRARMARLICPAPSNPM